MNFEVMESVELDEFTGSNTQIAKRKRTKRRRMALSSSSSGGGDNGDRKQGCIELEEDRNYESTVTTMSSEEAEDEDMANCLMMLSRSGSDGGFGVVADDSGKIGRKRKSNASRKPAEISAAGGVGLNNVYECRTCDKAFQSFQALGGHRASHHKKAKVTIADVGVMIAQEDVKPACNTIDQIQLMLNNNNNTAYSTAQPTNTKPPFSSSSVTHSTKVHQCSICGSAFSSGQALGGHMRRHRAAAVASSIDGNHISSAAAAESPPHEETPVVVERVLSNNNFLSSLDLNLPAPAEEDHHTRFHQQLFPTGRHDNNSSAIAAGAPSCMFSAPPPTVGCYF